MTPNNRAEIGIGRTFQNLALFGHMTVLDNIMVGRHHLLKNNFLTGALYWFGGARDEELAHRREIEEIIDFLEIQHVRKAVAGTLSYGLRKRVELARAMALKPKLILLDEPMAGMNLEEKEDMARYIVDLNEEWGMTVVMIEHDMGVVMDISHRVMVLDFGRKIAEGHPEEVLADAHVRRAYLGEADEVLSDEDDVTVAPNRSRRKGGVMDAGTVNGSARPVAVRHLPEAASRHARNHPRRSGAAREGVRHLAQPHLGRVPDARQDLRAGPAPFRHRPRRRGRADRRQPAGLGLGEIAAHAVGALSLGIYRDALDEEVAYLITYSGARAVFAEDEEQVDKLLALGDRVGTVKLIVYCDPRGMRKYSDPRLISVTELMHRGEAVASEYPALYDELVAATQGRGRGDPLHDLGHDGPAEAGHAAGRPAHPPLRQLPQGVDPKGPRDEYVSVLPLPWIMEQVYVLGKALLSRMRVNFVEEPETTMGDFREIGPTFVLFAPRVWEQIAADVRARIMDASPLKRRLFELGMRLGLGGAGAAASRSWLADLLLFRALRDRLGFTNLRSAATGGAALGPDTFRFFQAMGVPLRQLYGQTETLGAYTIHRPDDVNFDTVGVPFDTAIEVRIDKPDANGVGEIVDPPPQHVRRLLRQRSGDPPTCATAGCTPATPAISTRPAIWS